MLFRTIASGAPLRSDTGIWRRLFERRGCASDEQFLFQFRRASTAFHPAPTDWPGANEFLQTRLGSQAASPMGQIQLEKVMVQRRTIRVAIGVSTFALATLLSINWSGQGGVSVSTDSAQARVGRPLTPVSVAGVARRQNRRAAYGYGVGAGLAAGAAVATAGAVAAATAPGYYAPGYGYGNTYAAQNDPYFGQPHYATRAYYARSPYYGYTGWEDYSGRNFIKCQPGTMTKLDDGRMYPCQ
jgi:hypothetical protein